MLADLIATPGVQEELTLRGRAGVMALHGGLEAGTAPAARRCADISGASFYAVVQPPGFRWHVPSTSFDPEQSDRLARFLEHVLVAVSFHGFGRRGLERTVLIGGSNERLRREIAAAVAGRTDLEPVSDTARIPAGLRGRYPRNPVNLPPLGGVQIELSPQAREEAFLEALIEAVAGVLVAEERGVCAM